MPKLIDFGTIKKEHFKEWDKRLVVYLEKPIERDKIKRDLALATKLPKMKDSDGREMYIDA